MRLSRVTRMLYPCVLAAFIITSAPVRAQFARPNPAAPQSALTIPQNRLIQISELDRILKSGKSGRPLILQVGSHVMFAQAHIPGSLYAGPGSQAEGQHLLHTRVVNLPKDTLIVLYCGCCPWNRCPNVGPSYAHLMHMNFINVKVLYIPNNFGEDWMSKGYAVEKGE